MIDIEQQIHTARVMGANMARVMGDNMARGMGANMARVMGANIARVMGANMASGCENNSYGGMVPQDARRPRGNRDLPWGVDKQRNIFQRNVNGNILCSIQAAI